MGYALITGGSEGIGKAIANELAGLGYQIVLVALDGQELYKSAGEIKNRHNVDVLSYPADLSDKYATRKLFDWCMKQDLNVEVLINNVGVGYEGPFHKTPLERIELVMELNNRPMVQLSHMFLPLFLAQGKGYIMNVGSTASFCPVPFKAVYAASKNFVHAFTRALREELKETPVIVTALFPPPVPTNEGVKERIAKKGKVAVRLTRTPQRVANAAVSRMFRNKYKTLPGWQNRLNDFAVQVLPLGLQQRVFYRFFQRDKLAGRENEPEIGNESTGTGEKIGNPANQA